MSYAIGSTVGARFRAALQEGDGPQASAAKDSSLVLFPGQADGAATLNLAVAF